MKLKKLSDLDLVQKLKTLISDERKLLLEILLHLREMESRKLFLKLGFSSIFDYAVKELGYSESQAFRRISAMRLLKELPQIEEKVELGSLNLTHLTKAHEYFKSEEKKASPLSKDEKLNVLSTLETKTTRETEKLFAELSPETATKEKTRSLSGNLTEIRMVVSDAFLEKLQRFKELDSHVQVNPSHAEVFERLLDLALKQKDPMIKIKPSHKDRSPSAPNGAKQDTPRSSNPRFIPIAVKSAVYKRDHGKCAYLHPETGKICGSRFQIQIDHINPMALGGGNIPENLRLLCRKHNLFEAERVFGISKMNAYLKH